MFKVQCKARWKVKVFYDAQFKCWLNLTLFSSSYLSLICLQHYWCSLGSLALVKYTHPGWFFGCFWISFFEFALKLEAEELKRHTTGWKIPGFLFHAEASRWCLLPLHISWRDPTLSVREFMVFTREQQQVSQLLVTFQVDEGLGSESKTHPTVLRALEFLLPTILDVFMSCFLKILQMMLCCYHNNWCGLCCCWEVFSL